MLLAALCAAAGLVAGASGDAGPPCTSGEFICQIHLAVGSAPGTLRFSWVSAGNASTELPLIEWGVDPAQPLPNASGAVSIESYALADMCGPRYVDLPGVRGWEDPGLIHHAELAGLPEATPLYFRVGDAASGQFSGVVGPVVSGPKRGAGLASLAMTADMGTYAYAPAAVAPLGAVDDVVRGHTALPLAAVFFTVLSHLGRGRGC